jgi:scyllo-inositol 2-dehydrogenase (NADP+)
MNVIVIGLGVQGKKRLAVARDDVVATVDPVVAAADFRTVEEVPADCYDAALVCTPDQQKLPILEYLLSRGKHVLVEKPLLAERPEDLERLRARAAAAGVACWTAYNHRLEPNLVRLREVLAAGILGRLYRVRFFYGNGTAADVCRSPWRDQGLGVISDLGSHLLDLTDFLLGLRPAQVQAWSCRRFENRAYDHVILGAGDLPALEYEMSLLSWRNTFTIDVVAERGSAHVQGLCKWGPSTLTVRRRVFPSGRPTEEAHVVECPDPTWEAEYRQFQELCAAGRTSLDRDLWINSVLRGLQQRRKDVAWAA